MTRDDSSVHFTQRFTRRELRDHVIAGLFIAVAELAVFLPFIASDREPKPRIAYISRQEWYLAEDGYQVGFVKVVETSGRFPYALFDDLPSFLLGFYASPRHVFGGNIAFSSAAVIALPYWFVITVPLMAAALAVRRAGVVLPRVWLRSVDRRRGFEPIMRSGVPETRRDEVGNQPGKVR